MSVLTHDQRTSDVPSWVTIGGKRFGAASFEIEIDATIDQVWEELAGRFVDVAEFQAPVIASYAVGSEPTSGPGAVRHCDLRFKGKKVAIKERITDWIDTPDHKEYSYFVYESKGFPATVYNTWSVRVVDGRTLLRNVFYFRMKPASMSRMMRGQMAQAARGGVLGYKHYLETGERNGDPKRIAKQYAA